MRHWFNNTLGGSSDDSPLLTTVRAVRDGLSRCEIDYRLIGGLALELQGIDVGTKDIDILVDVDNFEPARQCLSDIAKAQATNDDGLRLDATQAPVYAFVGLDGGERPVSFFRFGEIEIDLLGATGPTEMNAMEDIPWLTTTPKGVPVAAIQAIVAIKLAVGRPKDIVHAEAVVMALGRKRAKTITRYLRTQDRLRDMPELVEEWQAAIERAAAMRPRRL